MDKTETRDVSLPYRSTNLIIIIFSPNPIFSPNQLEKYNMIFYLYPLLRNKSMTEILLDIVLRYEVHWYSEGNQLKPLIFEPVRQEFQFITRMSFWKTYDFGDFL